ncbi:MAG: PD-(D/E)XK nuclease-like domain-containing protein [Eubacteriales bacterium]|nr:PD-(D/E)XK nuclease-like domain-containing protein [Eubacteriales bacterium]
MILTADNYYSQEADKEFMSVSQFKDFSGTYGKLPCEFTAMEKLERRWEEPKSTALMVGSYVDSYFEGTLDKFKLENPDLFKRDGALKADYVGAERVIERIERDPYFMKFMSGEKQVIMTGELFGTKWKIKIDSYLEDIAIVDLKVMASITELKWVRDIGYLDFVRYWGYDIQGAIYQEIVRQNTGKKLPFYIAGATKPTTTQREPDIRIIHVTDNYLAEALNMVEMNMPRILRVKSGETEPDRCELCDCCRKARVLSAPISITDLTAGI